MAEQLESSMRCKLSVMDASGDKEVTWQPDSPSEVAAAKAIFDAVKKRGYLVYSQPAGAVALPWVSSTPTSKT
jgi:hypothetical protein